MKNNPFLPWGMPSTVMGRKEELRIVSAFVSHISNGKTMLLLLRGAPGMGKTVLLKAANNQAAELKMLRCFVKAPAAANALLREIHAELAAAVSDLSDAGEVTFEAARKFQEERPETFAALFSGLKKATVKKPLLIVVAEVDDMRMAEAALNDAARALESQTGVGILFSTAKKLYPPPGEMYVELHPVDEHDFREYVEKLTKGRARIGEECLKSIYRDSGGNPKLLQLTCWYLYDSARENEKIITQAHYVAGQRGLLSLLSHEWFSRQYAQTSDAEKKVLRQLARLGEASVTDIAKSMNRSQGPVATLLLRLEERGDVVKVKRGIYRLFAPLYASFVSER
ncbi:MAG: AAA family ATPase [Candidatus Micrarchaeota archaeon]